MTTLTKPKTLATYEEAAKALDNIARSRKATQTQKKKARASRKRLALDFIDHQEAEIAARTVQFQRFITEMEKTIKSIGKDSPIAALKTLNDVVGRSKELVEKVRPAKKKAKKKTGG